jgi:hypothetical protein
MIGLLETLVTNLLGPAEPTATATEPQLTWARGPRNASCTLYKGLIWTGALRSRLDVLQRLYGDVRAGSLFGGCLKIAAVAGPELWNIYPIELLQKQPEVVEANRREPDVLFFMDSANVWFYGVKDSNLFVFDASTDELDCLGPIAKQLDEVIAQWADTTAS